METLAAPEAPNLDFPPRECGQPAASPVEGIENPEEGNAEEESPFAVGDFVWARAKAKGHPWWPALVASPSESADRVAKDQRKTHSIPVSYFGDEDTLVWCEPKQLKPFLEVFDEMCRQSRSMTFLASVGNCMEEIGRCLELEITCRCLSEDAREKLLLGDRHRNLPVANYSPPEFLDRVRDVARDIELTNPLDAVRLRSWVFAFGKGFLQGESLVFQQRRAIAELVDKIDLEQEEESSLTRNGILEGPKLSPRKPQRGGKRRSMSKLIADMDLDTVEVADDEGEQILAPKKRKGKIDAVVAEEDAGSSSGRRERKKSKYLSPPYTNLREVGKFLSSLSKRLEAMSPRKTAVSSGSGVAGFSAINKCSGEEDDYKNISLSQIENMSACEIFSEFISTAAYPLHLKQNPSAKVVRCFFAMYRSSIYSDGAKFDDYKNQVHESIAKNENTEKDALKHDSSKKNSKHGDHQESGLASMKSKNDLKKRFESKKFGSKQQNNNRSEKQKPGGKRMPKAGISQGALDLPKVNKLNEGKGKQKPSKGKKSGDRTILGAPVECDLPLVDDTNEVNGKQKPRKGKGKRLGDRTNHGVPIELDITLLEDLNEGKEKQKPSSRKKSGDRTRQGAPVELDLPLVDDLSEGKEKQRPSRGTKLRDMTSPGAPVEINLPMVGNLNEGNEQKSRRGNKPEDSYSLGALLALECCRVDGPREGMKEKMCSSQMKISKCVTIQGALGDSGGHLANASGESKQKRKPGWKKKVLNNTTGLQAPVVLDLCAEDHSNEGEPEKGRKRLKDGTNAEAVAQKVARGSNAGNSGEKESISKYVSHTNNEVGLDVEPVSCQKPAVIGEKKIGSKEDTISKSLRNLGNRIAELKGGKSGRKKNGDDPLKTKPGRRKDKLSGTCFEGQAALQLTFHSGITLPSIEDLVTTYSKYGTLIDNRIELSKESNSALVVFAKSVDAESAFKDKAGPYGSVATYRLRYLPENLIPPPQIPLVFSPSQLIPNINSSPQQLPDLNSAVQKPPLPYIRKSLETMISTLASSPSLINSIGSSPDGLKPEARDNLVGEMQGLLLKVDKMLNGTGPGSSA